MGSVLRHLKGTVYGYGYHIINLVNGKIYAGQATDLESRWRAHRSMKSGCPYLNNAMSCYGIDAFEFRVVFEAASKEELDAWEIAEIASLDLMNPAVGYNLSKGGGGCSLSPEAEARRVSSLKAAFGRPGESEKRSARMKTALARPEVRDKMSASQRLASANPEVRAKRAAAIRSAYADPEVLAKLSVAQKAIAARPGESKKRSKRAKEVAARPGESEKRSARMKEVAARPGFMQNLANSTKAAWANPQSKAARLAAINCLLVPRSDCRTST